MRRPGPLFTVAALVILGVLTATVPALREGLGNAVRGDVVAMRQDIGGTTGVLIIWALALIHAVVWFPSEILNAAAGLLYGFWAGVLITHVAWVVSGLLAYAIGRHLGRPALRRLAGRERLDRAESFIERGGWQGLLAARLIPLVPFSFFSYVAGAARVPLGRYTWTTALGYLPLTVLAVLFGTRADELSLTDPLMWLALLGLLALLATSMLAGRAINRRS